MMIGGDDDDDDDDEYDDDLLTLGNVTCHWNMSPMKMDSGT